MTWLEPVSLRGHYCKVEPLTHSHHDQLVDAVKETVRFLYEYSNKN